MDSAIKMIDIVRAGTPANDTKNFVALLEEQFGHVRAGKTGDAGDQRSWFGLISFSWHC